VQFLKVNRTFSAWHFAGTTRAAFSASTCHFRRVGRARQHFLRLCKQDAEQLLQLRLVFHRFEGRDCQCCDEQPARCNCVPNILYSRFCSGNVAEAIPIKISSRRKLLEKVIMFESFVACPYAFPACEKFAMNVVLNGLCGNCRSFVILYREAPRCRLLCPSGYFALPVAVHDEAVARVFSTRVRL